MVRFVPRFDSQHRVDVGRHTARRGGRQRRRVLRAGRSTVPPSLGQHPSPHLPPSPRLQVNGRTRVPQKLTGLKPKSYHHKAPDSNRPLKPLTAPNWQGLFWHRKQRSLTNLIRHESSSALTCSGLTPTRVWVGTGDRPYHRVAEAGSDARGSKPDPSARRPQRNLRGEC